MPDKTSETTANPKKKGSAVIWIVLHAMLAVYALSSVCAKLAGQEEPLSFKFCMYYGILLLLLGLYAIGWQQIIKRMPLTAAYANKAVGVIWACIYGVIFFGEKITTGKIISGILTISGVVLFAIADSGDTEEADRQDVKETAENTAFQEKTTTSVNAENTDKITDVTNETAKPDTDERGGDASC